MVLSAPRVVRIVVLSCGILMTESICIPSNTTKLSTRCASRRTVTGFALRMDHRLKFGILRIKRWSKS
uniref:Putative secreted protein n=1 Tax=Anopheles darlingi TaxID=43151 RepID=A0A2M4D0L8_ANODA